MFQRSRASLAVMAATVLLLATGCFFLAFTPIANPGGFITFEGIVEETDPTWELDEELLFSCSDMILAAESVQTFNYDAHPIVNETGADQRISVEVDWENVPGLLALFTLDPPAPRPTNVPGFGIPVAPVTPGALPPGLVPPIPFDPTIVADCIALVGFFGPDNGIKNEVMLDGEAFMIVVANTPTPVEGEEGDVYTITVETK